MAAARQVLERSTMMLLTSSKACLRHPDCVQSRENRDTVFCQMRRAMDLIHYVVKDGVLDSSNDRVSPRGQTSVDWDTERAAAYSSLKQFTRLLEMARPRYETTANSAIVQKTSPKERNGQRCDSNMDHELSRRELMRSNSERDRHIGSRHKTRNYMSVDRELPTHAARGDAVNIEISILSVDTRETLLIALDKVVEKTQDFTDSAYTSHEHRENILLLCDRTKLELNQCLRMAVNMEQMPGTNYDVDAAIDSVLSAVQDLSHQLALAVFDQTAELNHVIKLGVDLVNSLRNTALNQELDRLQEYADRFHDYIDHMLEVSSQ